MSDLTCNQDGRACSFPRCMPCDEVRAGLVPVQSDADRITKQIALALDWGNVPPLDVLVKDIRARRLGAIAREKRLGALEAALSEAIAALAYEDDDLTVRRLRAVLEAK